LNASKQANNLPSKINQKTKIQSSRRQEGKTSSKLPNKQTMKPGAIKATKAQTNHGNKAATKRKVILSTKHRKASKQASRQASQQASRQACNEMSKQVRASQPAKQASQQASQHSSQQASLKRAGKPPAKGQETQSQQTKRVSKVKQAQASPTGKAATTIRVYGEASTSKQQSSKRRKIRKPAFSECPATSRLCAGEGSETQKRERERERETERARARVRAQ
jgi:hypothetical protein